KKWVELQRQLILPRSRTYTFWKYGVAACAALLVFAAVVWFTNNEPKLTGYNIEQVIGGSARQEKVNDTDRPMNVVLEDQSVVRLEPGARIRFPEKFAPQRREVILEGEAFFEVTKNPSKPFIVYAGDVVTKVLGTSFRVRSGKTGSDVTVAVKTGRVSVFSPKLTMQTKGVEDPETGGVVLTSNQQVVFMSKEQRLVKTLVEDPALVVPPVEKPRFAFDNAPVKDIFGDIEKAYGVDIVYDEALLEICRITTSIEEENLYEKLNIICTLLNGTYKIIDAQIVIDSKGC
uniref:FecR family protein n=1 Tax=Dyadobacter sp. TaxID=1914288 RepID=UPI003F714052